MPVSDEFLAVPTLPTGPSPPQYCPREFAWQNFQVPLQHTSVPFIIPTVLCVRTNSRPHGQLPHGFLTSLSLCNMCLMVSSLLLFLPPCSSHRMRLSLQYKLCIVVSITALIFLTTCICRLKPGRISQCCSSGKAGHPALFPACDQGCS